MGFEFTMLDTNTPVSSTYKPVDTDYPHSYQLSNYGINMLLNLLSASNVLDENITMPDLSDLWPPLGITEERAEELQENIEYGHDLDPPASAEELEKFESNNSRIIKTLSTTSNEQNKVPMFKLQTNDGWLISPDECKYMSDALSPFLKANPSDFEGEKKEMIEIALEWYSFVETAKHHNGFRVE